MANQQDVSSGNYRAVISVPANGAALVKRDFADGTATALSEAINIIDASGASLGTSANPLYVNSNTTNAVASFANITTAATTTVKSGAGTFYNIILNTFVASATIAIYDNTTATGNKIATLTLPSTITSDSPISLSYNLAFTTGLTIVTSAATDLTVTYH